MTWIPPKVGPSFRRSLIRSSNFWLGFVRRLALFPNLWTSGHGFLVYLWTSLEAATLMDELCKAEYMGHHALISVQNQHLMMYQVSPKEFQSLSHKVESYGSTLSALVANVKMLSAKTQNKLVKPLQASKSKK